MIDKGERILLSITQWAKTQGITRSAALIKIKEGRLPISTSAKKIGNSWIIEITSPQQDF